MDAREPWPSKRIDPALIHRMKPIEVGLDLAGNRSPVILAGELRGRLRKVFAIGVEQRDGQGDDSIVAIVHLEGQADEAPTIIVDEGADLERVGAGRGNDNFSQVSAFRGDSAQATIAEGGAVTSPVLNNRRRTTGGPN